MSEAPWFKFYASDWLAGTSGLSAAERGVYITLLALIYENEGPIPFDEGRLARRCGVTKPAFTKALGALIEQGKMAWEGDRLANRRAEVELEKRRKISQKASASAQERWQREREKTPQDQMAADAVAMRTPCETDANQSPESRVQSLTPPSTLGDNLPREAPAATQAEGGEGDLTDRERVLDLLGCDPASGMHKVDLKTRGYPRDVDELNRWKASGLSMDEILDVIQQRLKAIRARPDTPDTWAPDRFSFFNSLMRDKLRSKQAAPLTAAPAAGSESEDPEMIAWRKRLDQLRAEEAADAAERARRAAKTAHGPVH